MRTIFLVVLILPLLAAMALAETQIRCSDPAQSSLDVCQDIVRDPYRGTAKFDMSPAAGSRIAAILTPKPRSPQLQGTCPPRTCKCTSIPNTLIKGSAGCDAACCRGLLGLSN